MKKLTVLFLLIGIQSFLFAQNITFQDTIFKQTLIDLGVDTGNDGEISITEAKTVDSLSIIGQGQDNTSFVNIKDLENFTNLIYLSLQDFSISEEYGEFSQFFSVFTKLNSLSIHNIEFSHSPFPSLSLSNHGQLSSLIVESRLDVQISNCPNLKVFSLTKVNESNYYSITNCPELTDFIFNNNSNFPGDIPSFDGSAYLKLKKLVITNAMLDDLNLSQNINLEYLDCSKNQLSTLNLSYNSKLTYLNCQENSGIVNQLNFVCIHDLNFVQDNPNFMKDSNVEWKDCSATQLITFQDNNFKQALISLGIDTSNDNEISIAEAKATTSLNLHNLNLNNINGIQNFINLDTLILSNNSISFIDLTTLKNLIVLDISNNDFSNSNVRLLAATNLDFSNNLNLENLNVSGTNISSLDISMLTNLTHLDATNNPSLAYICVADVQAAEQNPNFQKDSTTEWKACGVINGLDKPEITISIYPNPTDNLVHIDAYNFSSAQIISLNGNVLIESNENTISLTELPQGVYIVKVVLDNTTVTKRIIKL